jgi:hypothetical protein
MTVAVGKGVEDVVDGGVDEGVDKGVVEGVEAAELEVTPVGVVVEEVEVEVAPQYGVEEKQGGIELKRASGRGRRIGRNGRNEWQRHCKSC